jgi:hypothetical protein
VFQNLLHIPCSRKQRAKTYSKKFGSVTYKLSPTYCGDRTVYSSLQFRTLEHWGSPFKPRYKHWYIARKCICFVPFRLAACLAMGRVRAHKSLPTSTGLIISKLVPNWKRKKGYCMKHEAALGVDIEMLEKLIWDFQIWYFCIPL